MPLNEFLANLPIDERNLFMPCPYCDQGDYFMVALVDGIRIFYCAEFSLPFFSDNYDKFIRDDETPFDIQKIDLKLNNNSFHSDEGEIDFTKFNPFLKHLEWRRLLQNAIESGMKRETKKKVFES